MGVSLAGLDPRNLLSRLRAGGNAVVGHVMEQHACRTPPRIAQPRAGAHWLKSLRTGRGVSRIPVPTSPQV